MSTITNPSNPRTIYIGAVVGLIFIAVIGAVLRIMFLRRMRRRFNAPRASVVVPSYPQSPNLYPDYQSPYVPPPAPIRPYPSQRPYSGPSYPNYFNGYPTPYNPTDVPLTPPTPRRQDGGTPRPAPSSRIDPSRRQDISQDGRASSRRDTNSTKPATRPTDGRNTTLANDTTSGNDLGPPPAYTLDGRE